MNFNCICSYIISNFNSVMSAARRLNSMNVCDENECYDFSKFLDLHFNIFYKLHKQNIKKLNFKDSRFGNP